MSQGIFDVINPDDSGTELATTLNAFKEAIVSGFSGPTRPTELDIGGGWIDTSNDPDTWSFKIWTGTDEIEVFRINLDLALASVALAVEEFSVKKVTDDTAGAILKLIKQRIANNGQVVNGDVVGRIQWIGRHDAAGNPVVAEIRWDASEDQTTSAFGGSLSFWSVPDGSDTLTKHMQMAEGIVETLVPIKITSLQLDSDDVATAATIAQLSAAKAVVEMTGATTTSIQGIDSDGNSKEITIHNRSSAVVTLKHQDSGAALADRFKLPGSLDYAISADGSATVYYCVADSRWKLKSTAEKNFLGYITETFYGVANTWTAGASTTKAKVRAYRRSPGMSNADASAFIDPFRTIYAWGVNTNGQLGDGSVVPKSSPVAVSVLTDALRVWGDTQSGGQSRLALSNDGQLYGWGINESGQLGVGDVTPRSSPVVVAGLHFHHAYFREKAAFALSTNNYLYAWGINTNGQLGLGDVTPRSAPVVVLGANKITTVLPISGANNNLAVLALNQAGAAYAWGINTNGNLGLGDVTPRSSPVAVLGGFTFSTIGGGAVSSSTYFFNALNNSGAAYAWGDNSKGQLGLGDVTARSSPVAVVGGFTFTKLITHPKSQSVFGLTSAGALYAWGANDQGQLGVGDVTARSSPVAVLGGIVFKDVRMYQKSVYGWSADGTLYAWGINANGQLGNADVVSRSSPVAVLGGFKFQDVRFADGPTDDYSVFGMTAQGSLYAWGKNTNGTLGLGDVTPRSSPVAVLGGFMPDNSEDTTTAFLTVTPSTAYTVGVTNGVSYFGGTSLGTNVYKIEVEYQL